MSYSVTYAERVTTTAMVAGIRRPITFLTLTPVRSASYPRAPPKSPELSPVSSVIDSEAPSSPALSATDVELKSVTSRRSSISSVGEKQRFLKLGPVFWGGVPGEEDFAMEE